jgi:hypothetical protein
MAMAMATAATKAMAMAMATIFYKQIHRHVQHITHPQT